MPTKREREYYQMGFKDGSLFTAKEIKQELSLGYMKAPQDPRPSARDFMPERVRKPKRKLSDWQKYVKLNSKFPRFKYKSGRKKGMINLKALGIAYRKTSVYKLKKKRR